MDADKHRRAATNPHSSLPEPCGFSRPKPDGSRLPNNTYALAGWRRPKEARLRASLSAVPSGKSAYVLPQFPCKLHVLRVINFNIKNPDASAFK